MPKLAYELKDFSAGTITNGDLADIPDGAASYSINVSPTSKLGSAESIQSNTELMTNVPAITSMVVRDGIDSTHHNLAVNIDSLFILLEDYTIDTMLGDFVEIAQEGQLFDDTDTDNWYSSVLAADGLTYRWKMIDTVVGYGYEISGTVAVSATVDTEWEVYAVAAAVHSGNGVYRLESYQGHILATDKLGLYKKLNSKTFKTEFYATATKTVVILKEGDHATATTSFSEAPMKVQFSKGGYLWGDLGQNLDLTETERGLFIGSATSDPHVQHKQSDRDGDVFSYLVPSECKPPTAQNALSNIDQMVWVYDSSVSKYKCLVMIYGEDKLWQLVQNTTTSPAVDYYEFTGSADYGNQPGFGGITESSDNDTLWAWDFEGFNIYQLTIPAASTTSQDWTITTAKDFPIKLSDIPDGGWIADVAQGKADTNKLYILFTRAGGLRKVIL